MGRGKLGTKRRGRLILTSCVSAAVLTVGALGAGAAEADGGNAGAVTTAPAPPAVFSAHDLAVAIDAWAIQHVPNVYGGLRLQRSAHDVQVFFTALDSDTQSTLQKLAQTFVATHPLTVPQDAQVLFASTPTSEAEQQKLNDSITADVGSGYWKSRNIQVVGSGPDTSTGTVTVRVVNPSPDQTAEVLARYGANARVEPVTQEEAVIKTVDRYNDTAPWNGGDFITDKSGDCTSGVPVHDATAHYLITAGHCFAYGTSIYNASVVDGLGSTTSAHLMGTITRRNTTSGGIDAEMIQVPGSSSSLLYTGPPVGAARSAVSGWTHLYDNDPICTDGAFDGEVCTETVSHTGQCATLDTGRYVCNLVYATGDGHTPVVGPGDSGSPIFTFSGSSLIVGGTVTGEYATTVYCTSAYQPALYCSAGVAFTQLEAELTQFSVSVN
jgi:hypothetical protein